MLHALTKVKSLTTRVGLKERRRSYRDSYGRARRFSVIIDLSLLLYSTSVFIYKYNCRE